MDSSYSPQSTRREREKNQGYTNFLQDQGKNALQRFVGGSLANREGSTPRWMHARTRPK